MHFVRTVTFTLGLGCCLNVGGCDRSGGTLQVAGPKETATVVESTGVETNRRQLSGIHRVGGSPVTATLILEPAQVRPGDVVVLKVKLEIEPVWEVSALEDRETAATKLQLEVPDGMVIEGDWQTPQAIRSMAPDGHSVYVDEAVFVRKLRVASEAPVGELPVKCRLSCQTCNDQQCLATEVELAAVVGVQ
jgi:hypothetical protein